MQLIDSDDQTIALRMTHNQALMLAALTRETCFGTVMHGFETRVGYPHKTVGETGVELHEILQYAGIS